MKGKTIFVSLIIFCLLFANFMSVNTRSELEEDPLVQGWSKDIRLTNDSADSMHPSIAVDSSGIIHVVWQDGRDDLWGIYYSRSTDSGLTWSDSMRINSQSNSGITPSIVVDQRDRIHVVWAGATQEEPYREIYYMQSEDNGGAWGEEVRLTYASGDSLAPDIVASDYRLHIVWSDKRDGNFEIYYKRSDDEGNSWSDDVRLTNTSEKSGAPDIVANLVGEVCVVWHEVYNINTGERDIFFRKSIDSGNNWAKSVRLTSNSKESREASIGMDSEKSIHIVWQEGSFGDCKVWYGKWDRATGNWTEPQSIVSIEGDTSRMVDIVVDPSDNLHLVWSDYRDGSGNSEIYYMVSRDHGETWSEQTRLSHGPSTSWYPKASLDPQNHLHVTWFDGRDDNKEIYYKRSLTPVGPTPIEVISSLNQSTCKPGNSITVSGNAVYSDSVVPNANVSIKILETDSEWNTTTDSDGNYEKEITVPSTLGNYTIRVKVTSGNHTGWKMMRLTVEQESTTDDGTTNDGTTNGEQPSGGEDSQWINLNYVLGIVGVIAACIIIGVVLVKHRRKAAKVKEEKKPTQMLRCPKCKKIFRVEVKPKPFNVKCPYCDKEGVMK
ncbi:MAG: exo-alpha-sialidase [Thermoplasmatales archaeon]|nr:exo-alpha-sialidase [Thermoplasmatales archaeon]